MQNISHQPNNSHSPRGRRQHRDTSGSASKCPICQAPVEEEYRPFCSKRCADIDLGRWLKGQYTIAGSTEKTEDVESPAGLDSFEID